jgi:ATP-dependent Lon protease
MKFDVSKVFYVFTFNDISKVDKILLDRLNVIHIPTPTDDEIINILQSHCLDDIISNVGLQVKINISNSSIRSLIHAFKNKINKHVSSGVREYYRILEKIIMEINKDILLHRVRINNKECLDISDLDFQKYLAIFIDKAVENDFSDYSHMYI